jgi:hypothetical protein
MEKPMPSRTAGRTAPALGRVVDLDRYQIDDLDGQAGRALLRSGRERMRRDGALDLDGFMRADAVAELIGHVEAHRDEVHFHDGTHNIYFDPTDGDLPATHPRRRLLRTRKGALAYDTIPEGSPIRALYESDEMTRFVRELLDISELHRDADPLGACSLMVYRPGDELGWHFDNAAFAVTLMLQTAAAGGVFEYVRMLRTPDDERYDAVEAVLDGDRTGVIQLEPQPGTLSLFRGTYSAHRVTPIEGRRDRVNAVLSYAAEPGQRLNETKQKLFYGRTA